jgi:uncharacterized protein YdeI (YjbR/CyaY-like superfamily)
MTSEAGIVVAGSADDWRAWLARNCRAAKEVWLVLHHDDSGMIERGLMTDYGQAAIEQAKATGTWQLLPDEPRRAMPDDLRQQLDGNDAARTNFESFPPSSKRLILEWIAFAKRPTPGGAGSIKPSTSQRSTFEPTIPQPAR